MTAITATYNYRSNGYYERPAEKLLAVSYPADIADKIPFSSPGTIGYELVSQDPEPST